MTYDLQEPSTRSLATDSECVGGVNSAALLEAAGFGDYGI